MDAININVAVNYTAEKPANVEKKTMLEKGVDFAKEKTAKGTLVGDHYVLASVVGAYMYY
ncbi:MAG: hypothetical protein U0457_12085 [Candidatus Sericytochromatia bacterium]